MRKERERKQRKYDSKQARKSNPEAQTAPDLGFDDPFFSTPDSSSTKLKAKNRGTTGKETEAERAQKANELDLLMFDDGYESKNHFNINHIIKNQKASLRKKKHSTDKDLDLQEDFQMDVNDPRFADVYNGGEFAIDPNNPAFRKELKGMQAILDENRRRKRDEGMQVEKPKKKRK